jgi:hypothetical protein
MEDLSVLISVLIVATIALLTAVYFFWNVVRRKVQNKELAEIAGLFSRKHRTLLE